MSENPARGEWNAEEKKTTQHTKGFHQSFCIVSCDVKCLSGALFRLLCVSVFHQSKDFLVFGPGPGIDGVDWWSFKINSRMFLSLRFFYHYFVDFMVNEIEMNRMWICLHADNDGRATHVSRQHVPFLWTFVIPHHLTVISLDKRHNGYRFNHLQQFPHSNLSIPSNTSKQTQLIHQPQPQPPGSPEKNVFNKTKLNW